MIRNCVTWLTIVLWLDHVESDIKPPTQQQPSSVDPDEQASADQNIAR